MTVNQDASCLRIIKPRDKAQERSLPCACQAEDAYHLSRASLERDAMKHLRSWRVAEANIFERYTPSDLRGDPCIGPVFHFRRSIQDFKNTPCSGEALL